MSFPLAVLEATQRAESVHPHRGCRAVFVRADIHHTGPPSAGGAQALGSEPKDQERTAKLVGPIPNGSLLHQLDLVGKRAELEWFFNRSESDMGLQSNFLAAFGRHGPGLRVPSPEDAVDAAHKHRRIRGWLGAIEETHAEVLRSAYEQRDWPPALWDEFGRMTGIVVRLACARDVVPTDRRAREVLEMDRAVWLASECHRAAIDPSFARLRTEAQGRLARANFAYTRASGDVRAPTGGRTR